MAYEFKKLSEVDAAESASDGANILVEDGGAIKRVPAAAIVPEIEIPEAPEIDLSEYAKKDELFSGKWDDISDKPLVEVFGDTLTWDGDTEGKENYGVTFKVSDAVPTFEDVMNGGTIYWSDGNTMAIGSAVKPADLTHEIYVYSDNIIIVKEGHPTKEPGTYLYRSGDTYATGLTLNYYNGFPKMVPLCQEFLDNVATKQEVFDNVTHWDDIPEKPTYPYMGNELTMVYDGNMAFTYISSINAYRGNVPTTAAIVKYRKPVAIYIDGVEHITNSWDYFENGVAGTPTVVCGNGAIAYGDYIHEDTGEPFCIEMRTVSADIKEGDEVSALYVYTRSSGTHAITICSVEYKEMEAPIDQKYFDEIVATKEYVDEKAGGVTSWNDLEGKPFGEDAEIIRKVSFDVNYDDENNYTSDYVDGTAWFACPYEFSSEPSPEYARVFVDGAMVCGDWLLYNTTATSLDVYGRTQFHGSLEWAVFYLPGGEEFEGVVIPKTGFYVRYNGADTIADGAKCEVVFSSNEPVVTPLDPKYLPDSVKGIALSCTLDRESNQDEIGANGATCSHTFEEIIALLEKKAVTFVSITTYPGAASQNFCTDSNVTIELYRKGYDVELGEYFDENLTYSAGKITWPDLLAQTEFIRFRSSYAYGEFQVQPEGVSVYLSFE